MTTFGAMLRPVIVFVLAALLSGVTSAAWSTPTPKEVDGEVSSLREVADGLAAATRDSLPSDLGSTAADGTRLPLQAERGLSVRAAHENESVRLDVPAQGAARSLDGHTVVYPGTADDTQVLVERTKTPDVPEVDSSVRMHITIDSARPRQSTAFQWIYPEGHALS